MRMLMRTLFDYVKINCIYRSQPIVIGQGVHPAYTLS